MAQLGVAYRRVDTAQNRGEPATAEFRAIRAGRAGDATAGVGLRVVMAGVDPAI